MDLSSFFPTIAFIIPSLNITMSSEAQKVTFFCQFPPSRVLEKADLDPGLVVFLQTSRRCSKRGAVWVNASLSEEPLTGRGNACKLLGDTGSLAGNNVRTE
jgi:hypothetical protein